MCEVIEHLDMASDSSLQMASADEDEVRSLAGNTRRADCGRKEVEWASVTFGSFVCLKVRNRLPCLSLLLTDRMHSARGCTAGLGCT